MKKIVILILACVFCSTVNAELKRHKITIAKETKQFGNHGEADEYRYKATQLSEPIQVDLGQKIEIINFLVWNF